MMTSGSFAVRTPSTGLSVFKQPVTNTPLNTTFPWTVAGGALNPQQRKDAETISRMNARNASLQRRNRSRTFRHPIASQGSKQVLNTTPRSAPCRRVGYRHQKTSTPMPSPLSPINRNLKRTLPASDLFIDTIHTKDASAAVSRLEAPSQAPDDGRLPLGLMVLEGIFLFGC